MAASQKQVGSPSVCDDRKQAVLAVVKARQMAVPSRLEAGWFRLRALRHIALRALGNLFDSRVRRHQVGDSLTGAPILAEVSTSLWQDGRIDEFPLVAGKVENLRIAVRAFDGIELAANQTFSFWQQLGRPTRSRGFVEGREVREGCVVPTIAGGLCQLSNALARAAELAGLVFVESHGHTARIEEAPSAIGDATIFWNYLDLRLSAPFAFRLEAQLTCDSLIVRIRGAAGVKPLAPSGQPTTHAAQPLAVRGCMTCDQTQCFRHRSFAHLPKAGRTAILLNGWTPEFETWLRDQAIEGDWFAPWLRKGRRAGRQWKIPEQKITRPIAIGLARTLVLRFNPSAGKRQAALMLADDWLAKAYVRQMKPHHTHLIIDQSLVAACHKAGVLGGRSYDVLVHALPAGEIQRRLDLAWAASPAVESLNDYRTGPDYVEQESRALYCASRTLTPHAEIATFLSQIGMGSVTQLPWQTSQQPPENRSIARSGMPVIGFPASALPRKGVIELALAARQLGWSVLIGGKPDSGSLLWAGVDVRALPMHHPDWLKSVDLVVLPAHIEHAPRKLLEALAAGIPVVASRACGLPPDAGQIEVAAGDLAGLVAACQMALAGCHNPDTMVDAG
ncbi:MAG: hypothetical protein RL367_2408 [Pseudomonadota bacterium]